jgi:hypothetical protein
MIKKMAIDGLCQSITSIVCLLHFQGNPILKKKKNHTNENSCSNTLWQLTPDTQRQVPELAHCEEQTVTNGHLWVGTEKWGEEENYNRRTNEIT